MRDYNFPRKRCHMFSGSSGVLNKPGMNPTRQRENILNYIHFSHVQNFILVNPIHLVLSSKGVIETLILCSESSTNISLEMVAAKEDFYLRQNLHNSIYNRWNQIIFFLVFYLNWKRISFFSYILVLNFSMWVNKISFM